jgi:hypothetical protein
MSKSAARTRGGGVLLAAVSLIGERLLEDGTYFELMPKDSEYAECVTESRMYGSRTPLEV